ncbi:MAG: DUF998 domain-containing protein [Lentilitoribacter sp.]
MVSRDIQSLALVILPVISLIWLVMGVGIIGAIMPNYSHVSQFMSALGAVSAPFANWANYAVFLIAEIPLLVFLALLSRRLSKTRAQRISILLLLAYTILLIFAALLPCDVACDSHESGSEFKNTSTHIAHMFIAAIAYPLALIGLLPLFLSTPKNTIMHRFAVPLVMTGFCLFFAIVLMPETQGLFQRLLEVLIYVQLIMLGFYAASNVKQTE